MPTLGDGPSGAREDENGVKPGDMGGRLCRPWSRGRLLGVVDNLSIHTHPRVIAWVRRQQGRVQLVFLPLHASWLNQIELWFSVLERQCLKRAGLQTPMETASRIIRFTRHWNRSARPFRWTFKGYPLRRKWVPSSPGSALERFPRRDSRIYRLA